MKNTYITIACCLLAAFCAPALTAQEANTVVGASAVSVEKPIIAVPLFVNKSKGQTKRIAPGTYSDKAKYEATVRLDAEADDEKSRYIESRGVEYTDGEYPLPDSASEIATDAATSAIVGSRKFRVLTRSTPALKSVDAEVLFQGTGAEVESTQVFSTLKSCNAKYLLLGRLNRFRVDRTEGEAYGVRRRQIVTSVSVDMQLIDVNTMEIIAGENMTERLAMRIPEGVTKMSALYDWEPVLRQAVSNCVPKFLSRVQVSPTSPDELETAAPMAEVNITSTPEGADVEFNGNFVGNTPCSVTLPSSVGVMTITAAGYEPWSKRIKPAAGMKIAPRLKEKKEPATPMPPPAGDVLIVQ